MTNNTAKTPNQDQNTRDRGPADWPRPKHGKTNPLTYDHPYQSMRDFAQLLALRYDYDRTQHSYYRAMRLIHEHFNMDPTAIDESRIRDYFLFVKTKKRWKPKTIRQSVASSRMFYGDMLGRTDWKIFGQIRTKDHNELPLVLSREQVVTLLSGIRLRRYRIPVKLIYCAGLRISECLALTIHDISKDGKLRVRKGKRGKDRIVPISSEMLEDLRHYWSFHRNRLLIFPNAGRGSNKPAHLAARMHESKETMPVNSLQRLIVAARKSLNIPAASAHTLRHSIATHLIEAGASVPAVQALLGHTTIDTTMVYVHLTHRSEQQTLQLIERLSSGLPR